MVATVVFVFPVSRSLHMSKDRSIRHYLKCHGQEIKVTGRASKQQERGRLHRCKECGQEYVVNVKNNVVVNEVPA
jgi:predicted SprT family Zn-dependent metalloprotease